MLEKVSLPASIPEMGWQFYKRHGKQFFVVTCPHPQFRPVALQEVS